MKLTPAEREARVARRRDLAIKRIKARERRLRAQGLCRLCGAEASGKSLCPKHAKRNVERAREWQRAHLAAGRCGTCGVRPHRENRKTCQPCRDAFQRARSAEYAALKEIAFAYYGSVCMCCGESRKEFLAFDHKDGGGNKHRRTDIIARSNMPKWLKREGYPDSIQLLCHNCNVSKGLYGYCPHEVERVLSAPEPLGETL